jgi:ClpP class serine protease
MYSKKLKFNKYSKQGPQLLSSQCKAKKIILLFIKKKEKRKKKEKKEKEKITLLHIVFSLVQRFFQIQRVFARTTQ